MSCFSTQGEFYPTQRVTYFHTVRQEARLTQKRHTRAAVSVLPGKADISVECGFSRFTWILFSLYQRLQVLHCNLSHKYSQKIPPVRPIAQCCISELKPQSLPSASYFLSTSQRYNLVASSHLGRTIKIIQQNDLSAAFWTRVSWNDKYFWRNTQKRENSWNVFLLSNRMFDSSQIHFIIVGVGVMNAVTVLTAQGPNNRQPTRNPIHVSNCPHKCPPQGNRKWPYMRAGHIAPIHSPICLNQKVPKSASQHLSMIQLMPLKCQPQYPQRNPLPFIRDIARPISDRFCPHKCNPKGPYTSQTAP